MGRNSGKRLIGWKGHRPLQEGVQSKTHILIYLLCKGAVSEKATKPALEAAIKKILNTPGFSSCLCLWSNSSFLLPLPDDTLRKTHTHSKTLCTLRHKLIRTEEPAKSPIRPDLIICFNPSKSYAINSVQVLLSIRSFRNFRALYDTGKRSVTMFIPISK